MDRRYRIAQQRALCRQSIGALRAAAELFSIEDGAVAGGEGYEEYSRFTQMVDELEMEIFSEGPLA